MRKSSRSAERANGGARPIAPHACPDCPATHSDVLDSLLPEAGRPCAFRVASVAPRQPIPHEWFATYGCALVRRGIVVRQRVDAGGRATAVDAVGPGGALLLHGAERGVSAYAAADAMLCLCPTHVLGDALDGSARVARDLMRLQAAAIERMERIADARNRHTVAARVAALLCALADGLSPARRLDVVPADLQQRDLAALLAMRHESVCRELGTLERDGLIGRDPEGIRLLHRDRLEAI